MKAQDRDDHQYCLQYHCKFSRGPRKYKVMWPDVTLPDFYSKTEYERNINGFSGAQIFVRSGDKYVPIEEMK